MKFLYTILFCAIITSPFYGWAQNNPNSSTLPAATPVTKPGATANPNQPNYVTTWEPNMPITDTASVVSKSRIIREVRQSTTYYDGLGRVKQSVAKGLTFGGRDLVYPVVYDELGRQQYMYMSYAQTTDNTNDGRFKTDPFGAQEAFFKDATLNPETVNENIFYRKVEYELSPLGKILKNYSPGNSWSTHGTETKQLANTDADSVRIWNLINEVPVSPGIYAPGELLKEVYIDEQQNQTVVYKDKQGQVVLKKVLQSTINTAHVGWLCTYYVYNDADMLSFVIPPAATNYTMIKKWSNIADVAKELCYHYVYDDRNRRVIEEVPGKGALYKVFDLRDRLVFTQDAEQRAKSPMEWYTVLYDGQDRTVMTAIYKGNSTREALQTTMNTATASTTMSYQSPLDANLALYYDDGSANYNATQSIEFLPGFESNTGTEFLSEIVSGTGSTTNMTSSYSLPGIAMSALTPLIYMYYDDYNYPGVLKFKSDEFSKLSAADTLYPEAFSGNYSTLTKYLATGMKVRVLGTDKWLTTTTYYNDRGRPIQLVSTNVVGGKDILTMMYSFSGNLLSSYLRHQNPKSITSETRILTTNAYDHRGRQVSVKKRLNDDARFDRTIATYSYDELGRINKKCLGIIGNEQPIDSLLMTYNVRGWLKSINKDFVQTNSSTKNWFGEDLSYDYGFNVSYKNGNIAGQKWKSRSDGTPRSYGYTYDATGRLAAADFAQQDVAGAAWGVAKMDFSVSNLTYDANGGMQSMIQQGMNGTAKETMDNLSYKYFDNSNKLRTVADANTKTSTTLGDFINGTNGGDDYTYNLNGNMISDENRNISSVSYNHLNQPEVITIRGKGTITYQYDALGNKLRKTVIDNSNLTAVVTTVTDYAGGFIYQNDSLQTVGHEEGRIRPLYIADKPVGYAFDYFEKDHLGNIRLVLTDQPDSSVYAASMEVENAMVEAATFSNIEETRVEAPVGYFLADTTINNKYVAKLNGKTDGNKKGPAIVLRVMAGDTVMIKANAFYKSQNPTDNSDNTPSSIITGALQAITGSVAAGGAHSAAGANRGDVATTLSNNDYRQFKKQDTETPDVHRPKAYLNYVLFDDQFNMVDQNSGMKQVQATPDEVQQLAVGKTVMQKAGFLYVYTDNETAQDVYFDNVQVMVLNGPVLEETHYYPFGLTMEAISYNALKGMRYAENKFKFNGIESNRDLGLNQYEAFYRNYDPQIGRWMQVDPKPNESTSTYSGMGNNPVLLSDFLGDTAIVGTQTLPEVVVKGKTYNAAMLRDQLINQWATLSGLNLVWDNKNSRIVNLGVKTNKNISLQAREDVIAAVDGPGKVYIDFAADGSQTPRKDWRTIQDPMSDNIILDPHEIEDLVNGTSPDLDPLTFGIGMTALHELGHTFIFGRYHHDLVTRKEFNHLDQVDVRMNKIRGQLGKRFGVRTSYAYLPVGKMGYLPMSQGALQLLIEARRQIEANKYSTLPKELKLNLPSKGVIIFPLH